MRVIKILAPDRGDYRGDELEILDSNLEAVDLEFSSQACLNLPPSTIDETLVIRHKQRPEGLLLKIDQNIRGGLTAKRAEPQEIPRLEPPCDDLIFKGPNFASFRSSSLSFGAPYRVQEDILTRDLELLSTRVEGGLNHLTMLAASVTPLPPGNYVYRLTLQHPFQKSSAAQVFQCPFIYDDVKPKIQISQALVQEMRKPLPPLKELNWVVHDSYPTVLEVCQKRTDEGRGSIIEDPLKSSTSWKCSEQDYQKQVFRTGAEPGRCEFCVRAADLAMNKSEPVCGQYLVSHDNLKISTSWQVPQLHIPDAAILPARLLDLPARIEILHPDFETTGLRNKLQCRVRLKTENGTIYPGRFVSCSSGRCQGQTMENFVPCDQNIHLGLEALWSRPWSQSVQLTLDTRLEGVGGEDEMTSHSLWLNQASLRYENPGSKSEGLPGIPQGRIRDFMHVEVEQYLLLTDNRELFLFDQVWKKVSIPMAMQSSTETVFLSQNGSNPVILFKTGERGFAPYAIERSALKPLEYEPNALKECTSTPVYQAEFLLCHANDAILKIGLQSVVRYPWPHQELCQRNPSAADGVHYRLTRHGELLLLCSGQLLQLQSDSATLIARFTAESAISNSQWVEDGQGRVWLTWDEFGGYFEKGQWHDVVFPHEEDMSETLVVNSQGRVVWRGLHWDFESKTWGHDWGLAEMPWNTVVMALPHSQRLYAVSTDDFNKKTFYFEGPYGWESLPSTEQNSDPRFAIWSFTRQGNPIISRNGFADQIKILIRQSLATFSLEASRRVIQRMSLGRDAEGNLLAFGFDGEAYRWDNVWIRQPALSVFASENYAPEQFSMNVFGEFFQIGMMGLSTFKPNRGWSYLLEKDNWPAYVDLQMDAQGRAWFYETELSQDRVVVADAGAAKRINVAPGSSAALIRGISPDFRPGETLVLYGHMPADNGSKAGLCSLNPDTAHCEPVVLPSLPGGVLLSSLYSLGHGSFALYYVKDGLAFLHVVNPGTNETRDVELPFDDRKLLKVGIDQKGRLIIVGSWRKKDSSEFVEQVLMEHMGRWEVLLREDGSAVDRTISFDAGSFVVDGRNQLWLLSDALQEYLIRIDLNGF
jgi:hypothetical protein